MIVSKPKTNTLFALSMFIILCLAAVVFSVKVLISDTQPSWFYYFVVFLLGPVIIVLMIKVLWGYKIVKLGKGRLEVRYPFRLSKRRYSMQELIQWKEHIIKTPSGKFQEIKMIFGNYKLKVSYQEYTDYLKIRKYLLKKAARKKIQ